MCSFAAHVSGTNHPACAGDLHTLPLPTMKGMLPRAGMPALRLISAPHLRAREKIQLWTWRNWPKG